jgi:N6-adenosine-specific RNA methylase IME4
LQRAELTALEQVEHLSERKKVWLAKYPETGSGKAPGNKGNGMGKASATIKTELCSVLIGQEVRPLSFAEDAARRVGQTARQIRKKAAVGDKLCSQAKELIRGTLAEDRLTELQKLAKLEPEEQVIVAGKLGKNGEDTRATGKARSVSQAKRQADADKIRQEPLPLPSGPFRVIVADPPWRYGKRPNDPTKRESVVYSTMTADEIKQLPVRSLSADDAILWLWTTNAHLPEAFGVAAAWGFEYRTLLTWAKDRPGMGDWLRGQTEQCLFCIRGNPTVELTNQSTLLSAPRTGHSAKPGEFYTLVERLCPGSKLELFSRAVRDGWQAWGAGIRQE